MPDVIQLVEDVILFTMIGVIFFGLCAAIGIVVDYILWRWWH